MLRYSEPPSRRQSSASDRHALVGLLRQSVFDRLAG
jgi:hypothetical protein